MKYKYYMRLAIFTLTICSMFSMVAGTVAANQDSPYLSGLWLHKAWNEEMTNYMLCRWNADLAEPGVRGTGLCLFEDPMDVPTPEGGIVTMSAEMQGTWVMEVPGKYKAKALAFVTSEGAIIGTADITGTMVREEEGKMSAEWNHKLVDLDGNVLAEFPPMKGELTRIDVE